MIICQNCIHYERKIIDGFMDGLSTLFQGECRLKTNPINNKCVLYLKKTDYQTNKKDKK